MAQATSAPTSAPAPVAFDARVLVDDSEFLGVIVVDESVRGDYGPQWHYAVKPVDYDLGGKTGAYNQYIPTDKTGMRTKFGIALSAFLKVCGSGSFKMVGNGEMVGTVLKFKRVEQKFGKDRQTKQEIIVELIIPISKPDADEQERARAKMAGQVSAPTPTVSSMSEDDINALVVVLVGKTPETAVSGVVKSKLATNLKGSVLNGTAIPALLDSGHLTLVNGKYALPVDDGNDPDPDSDANGV